MTVTDDAAGVTKPLRLLILGFGIRGRTYAGYARERPDAFTVVGVADPCRANASDIACPSWNDWQAALDSGVAADAAVIALPDRLHCAACVRALERGLAVLLEKPVGVNWKECERIRTAQQRAGRVVLTGYVLRHSTYYRQLAEVVASGTIGALVSIHHLAAVSYGKAAHAYCRGNWSVESNGTGMLVNKCSHDFDLIDWWTSGRKCVKISSSGSLVHWRAENRPVGAAARCGDCAPETRRSCPFDAYKLYYERKDLRYHFADESDAAILEMIRSSPYGRCVYACGNDSVDHQTVLMEYEGGLTVTLAMESFTNTRRRETLFCGTRGEIVADGRTIEVRPFLGKSSTVVPPQGGRHGGGDREILSAFARLVRANDPALAARTLASALESHRLAFLAEDSRRTGRTLSLSNPLISTEGGVS